SAAEVLARVYKEQGRLSEAAALLRGALADARAREPADGYAIAALESLLAAVLVDAGDFAGADEAVPASVAPEDRVGRVGPDARVETLASRAQLGERRGDHASAERDFKEALAMVEPFLGDAHPTSVRLSTNLATVLMNAAKYAEAAEVLERAAAGFE